MESEQSTFSLLHATRDRPELMWKCYERWHKKASGKFGIEHIFSMDTHFFKDAKRTQNRIVKQALKNTEVIYGCPCTSIGAWNRAWKVSKASKVLIQMSDDFDCPHNWDLVIAQKLGASLDDLTPLDRPLVLGVADPHSSFDGQSAYEYSGDGKITILIGTRAYFDGLLNYFLYPEYPSLFSDDDATQCAAMWDALVDGYDVIFPHHWRGHPDRGAAYDATYKRQNRASVKPAGQAILSARLHACFPGISYDAEDINMGPLSLEERHEALEAMNLTAPHEGYGPRFKIYRERRLRDWGFLQNEPFPEGDCRTAFMKGDYEAAQEGIRRLFVKYQDYCGGRFEFPAGRWLWNECVKQTGMGNALQKGDRL